MDIQPIKRVAVELANGEVLRFTLPETSQGFYRERYTYEGQYDKNGNFLKWTNRIYYHEIVWTLSQIQQEAFEKENEESERKLSNEQLKFSANGNSPTNPKDPGA